MQPSPQAQGPGARSVCGVGAPAFLPGAVPRLGGGLAAVALALALAGCGREEVRVYRVPKEQPSEQAAIHGGADAAPRIRWTAPAGWEPQEAGGVRVVRFAVRGPEGQSAEVGVVPLTSAQVPHRELVNVVRAQVGLAPVSEEELAKLARPVAVGPVEGELVEMTSTNALFEDKWKARVLMVAARHGETLWLFKMAGTDPLVQEQRGAFLEFLKSVSFEAPDNGAASGTAAAAPGAGSSKIGPADRPQWEVPADWQEQPPGPMVQARFAVVAAEGRAEVTVSVFPGETGGLAANVNRWRGQVGLEPVPEAEVDRWVESLDLPGGRATLADMTGTDRKSGQPARLLGVIVPRRGRTWFFKMTGSAPLVGTQKAAFLKFVQSAKLPDA